MDHHAVGQCQNRHPCGRARQVPDAMGGLDPIHDRHLDVHQHHIGGALRYGRYRRGAVLGHVHRMAIPAQDLTQEFPIGGDVVGHQDRKWSDLSRCDRRLLVYRCCVATFERQLEPEPAAAIWHAVQPDHPTHGLDQRLADRQPQLGAAIGACDRAVGLHEWLEQIGSTGQRDADAGILDLEPQPVRILRHRLHAQGDAAPAGEHESIADPVDQHLDQSGRITTHHQRRRHHRLDLELALDRLQCQQRAYLLEFAASEKSTRSRSSRPASSLAMARMPLSSVDSCRPVFWMTFT